MEAELEVKEIESTLKRAKKYVMYFSKEFYEDTFIRVLVSLIFLCLLAIFGAIYLDSGMDEVRGVLRTLKLIKSPFLKLKILNVYP